MNISPKKSKMQRSAKQSIAAKEFNDALVDKNKLVIKIKINPF